MLGVSQKHISGGAMSQVYCIRRKEKKETPNLHRSPRARKFGQTKMRKHQKNKKKDTARVGIYHGDKPHDDQQRTKTRPCYLKR